VPSNVQQVFAAAGIHPDGCMPWSAPVPETAPGVYVIARRSGRITDGPQQRAGYRFRGAGRHSC